MMLRSVLSGAVGQLVTNFVLLALTPPALSPEKTGASRDFGLSCSLSKVVEVSQVFS
jgi:hypothetical protein